MRAYNRISILFKVNLMIFFIMSMGLIYGQTSIQIMDELVQKDNSFMDSYTLDFKYSVPVLDYSQQQGRSEATGQLVKNGGSDAIELTNTFQHPPVYLAPESENTEAIDYDTDGSFLLWRNTNKIGITDSDIANSMYRDELISISETGEIKTEESHLVLMKHANNSDDNIYERDQILFIAGIGYSRYVEEITEINGVNGLLEVTATGTYGPEMPGIWKLRIDRTNGLIVRSADFTNSSGTLILEIENQGNISSRQFKIAKSGSIKLNIGNGSTYDIEIEIINHSLVPNTNLITRAKTEVAQILHTGSEIIDLAKSPSERIFIE